MRLQGAIPETRLPHQLFGVMGPAFAGCIANEYLPQLGRRSRCVHELQEVAGPDLVRRDEKEICPSRYVCVPYRLGPLGVGWSDLVDRRQILFIGSGNPD